MPVTFPLSRKLALALLVVSVLPLLATGLYAVGVNRQAVRELNQHLAGAVSDELARTIEEELVDAEDALDAVGRLLTDRALDPVVTERLVLHHISADSALDHVHVYDATGAPVAVVAEADVSEAPAERPPPSLSPELRAQAEAHDATALGVRATAHGPGLLVVVPLRGGDAELVTGFVAAVVVLAELPRRMAELRERHYPSVPDALLVTDDAGVVLAASDGGALDGHRPEVFDAVDPATAAAWSGRFAHPSGERLGEVRPLPGRPLRVVVQVPVAIAFASLEAMQIAVGLAVLVACILAIGVGVALSRRLTRPIAALVQLAGHLGARRWGERVELHTHDELQVLGTAMSRAAAELGEGEKRIAAEIAIRNDLGRYLAKEVVERVVRREQDMNLGGVRRPITVLFADVVAFTPLTSRLRPEDTVALLNDLFTILTEIVFRHGGTVDKFIGDSVMAIFNAPSDQPDHAERALRTAEDMLRFLETGNAGWQERYGVTIQLAIGINTGEAVVGNIGSEARIEYTAIGDTVNVAARLEAIARPQQILVTEATRAAAGDGFTYFDGGEQTLPGRTEPVHLWEVSP